MSSRLLRSAVHHAVLRTQFRPFSRLHRGYYALAVRACAWRLRRLRGVRALYLWRGLPKGRSVYGLSDVDLLVLVDRHEQVEAVDRELGRLRLLFPVVPDRQAIITSVGELARIWEGDPFHAGRLSAGMREARCLFGPPLASLRPPAAPAERDVICEELVGPWQFLTWELMPQAGRSRPERRYVIYKCLADAARVALVAEGAEVELTREAALERAPAAYPEVAEVCREVRSWRRRLLGRGWVDVDPVIDAMAFLSRRAIEARRWPDGRLRVRSLPLSPAAVRTALGEPLLKTLRRAAARLRGACRAVLVPRLFRREYHRLWGRARPGRRGRVDSFLLVLIGSRRPLAADFLEFNRIIGMFSKGIDAIFSDGEFAFPVRPRAGRIVRPADPPDRPDIFPDLSATRQLGGGLEVAAAAEMDVPFTRPGDLRRLAEDALAGMRVPLVKRLGAGDYLARLWEAGRLAVMASQLGAAVIEMPVVSEQVVESLAAATPDEEAAIRRAYAEYRRARRGEANRAGNCREWAEGYTWRLQEALL
jgi:hypothetical protein